MVNVTEEMVESAQEAYNSCYEALTPLTEEQRLSVCALLMGQSIVENKLTLNKTIKLLVHCIIKEVKENGNTERSVAQGVH